MNTIPLKDHRKMLKVFNNLSDGVKTFLAVLDEEMKKPSSYERGVRIAKLCNEMEMFNDRIRMFTLKRKQ
jgi:hypothetical protein